jgi:cytochrome c oxidase cbb3-type subunit 3
MAEYKDEILEHEYDGIQEMDNSLPRWWLYLFILSIIWAVLYMLYYHVFDTGYLQKDEYLREINPDYVRASEADLKLLGILPEFHSPFYIPAGDVLPDLHSPFYIPAGDETPRSRRLSGGVSATVILTAATDTIVYETVSDASRLADGQQKFLQVCSPCHGKLGEGGVGPNLTDDYWIHGADISAVVRSIKYGYPAQGMIAWRGTLKEEEILNVASYVRTLRGTDPPGARPPQGELMVE